MVLLEAPVLLRVEALRLFQQAAAAAAQRPAVVQVEVATMETAVRAAPMTRTTVRAAAGLEGMPVTEAPDRLALTTALVRRLTVVAPAVVAAKTLRGVAAVGVVSTSTA
jgi:hypothetical protein